MTNGDFKTSFVRRTSRLNAAALTPRPKRPDINDQFRQLGPKKFRDHWDRNQVDAVEAFGVQSDIKANPSKAEARRLKPVDFADFCALKIKPREMVLNPVLPEKGLVMCYAARGTGKTHVALGIGFAVSTKGTFFKWEAPKARKVLLLDGEMPAAALQERFNAISDAAGVRPEKGMFQIIAGDLEEFGIGNLADPKLQHRLDSQLEGVELLILDNLSSLTAVIRDNDAESWNPIQSWLLRLRRRGVSVLIVHHAGKGGEQRGTSRREDVLDTSISLRRPGDYRKEEGARFEVHIEKGRGIHGSDAKPFEAQLITAPEGMQWAMRGIEDVNKARVAKMLEDGLSVRDIADETGIPKSTVGDLKKRIEAEKSAATVRGRHGEN
jgi:putative DNA primase/helicase